MSDSGKAVFLSYASQDAEAVKRICDALRSAGVEVWFDQSELVGGDAWDQKIRGQIGSCGLFLAIISANTQARREGYFRIEWKLAAQRTHAMADGTPFLVPIVIDETKDTAALVPAEFKAVQWSKLPKGETPPAFCARVKKLLEGEVMGQGSEVMGRRTDNPEPMANNPRLGRWWWVLPMFGVAMALILVMKEQRKEPIPPAAVPPAVSPSNPSPAAPAASEARQLTAKAQLLFEKVDSTLDDFTAAEGLLQKAVALDPADGLVLAVYSRLNTGFSMRGFDYSPRRVEEARGQMERAMRLAPEEEEVWLARGSYLRRTEGSRAEAEQALRKALALAPHDSRPWFDLAWAIDGTGKDDEVFALLEKSVDPARPGSGALARYNQFNLRFNQRRFAEADALVRAAVAELPSTNFVTGLARNEITWQGNGRAAVAAIEQLSPERSKEPRAVYFSAYCHLLAGEPAEALRAIRRLSVDFIADNYFNGPSAYWEGRAQQQLGNAEAARVAWEGALAVSQREGPGRANRGLIMEAELLARLGREEEALRRVLAYEQAGGARGTSRQNAWIYSAVRVYAVLGRVEEALPLLEAHLTSGRGNWPLTPALLRLDPLWDKIRNDPRVQKLCAEPQAQKSEDGPSSLSLSLSPPPDAKSVAVLAFANLSSDKEQEYFSDGISEELLNVLAKVPGLKVSARTSAFYFKGKEVPVPEIAKQLGVAYVVEGSVRKAGSQIRITAQLIKAADGFHVWSDTFTRDLKDVFAVQDEIAGLVAKNLQAKLSETGTSRRAADLETQQLYLQGKYFLNQFSVESGHRAIELLQAAVQRDPHFAPAWAALSEAGTVLTNYAGTRAEVEEGVALARRASARAIAEAPDLVEGYLGQARVQRYDFDWPGAAASLRRAVELAPDAAGVVSLAGQIAYTFGQGDRARQLTAQAIALDPVNPEALALHGFSLQAQHRFTEAEVVFRRISEVSASAVWGHAGVSACLIGQGRFDEAVREAGLETNEWSRLFALAIALRAQGRTAGAEAALAELMEKFGDVAAYQVAGVYSMSGDRDHAFAWLERSYRQKDPGLSWLRSDREFEGLRTDPRWEAFLRKLGLADEQVK